MGGLDNPLETMLFGLKEKLPESIKSSKFDSHRGRMSGEFDSRKDLHLTKFEQMPQIFVKPSFRECCSSNVIWVTFF